MFYTVKEWKKFKNKNTEIELLARYEVILTDYKTRKEKILGFFKRSEKGKQRRAKIRRIAHKINVGIDTVVNGINKFSQASNKSHLNPRAGDKRMDKLTRGLNQSTGTDHDFRKLTGHEKQRKMPKL